MSRVFDEIDGLSPPVGGYHPGGAWEAGYLPEFQCWAQVGEVWNSACGRFTPNSSGLCNRHRGTILPEPVDIDQGGKNE